MKERYVKIDTCNDCPFLKTNPIRCWGTGKFLRDTVVMQIPDWCPLPEVI